jgi:hypothetical protein
MTDSDRELHDRFLRLFLAREQELRVFVRSLLFSAVVDPAEPLKAERRPPSHPFSFPHSSSTRPAHLKGNLLAEGATMTRFRSTFFLLFLIAACVLPAEPIQAADPQTPTGEKPSRDPWLWPFSPTSIWNMPIGSGAVYKHAHLPAAKRVGVDIQHLLRLKASDPLRTAIKSAGWRDRSKGTEPLGYSLNLPDGWIVPDTGKGNPYGLTPNSNFAFLLPDGDQLLQGCGVTHVQPDGPVFLPGGLMKPQSLKTVSIRGDGLKGGGQGASYMSALGGTIRLGELTGTAPIRHAIKINPFAARCCFYSDQVRGFRWPAFGADAYAAKVYKGTDPSVVMGSLLALPPDATPEKLGIATVPGRLLFAALQDYGAYFTEDAAWDTWDLIVERGAEEEFAKVHGFSMKSETWRDEVNRLATALHVVDNNGPENIGGGGAPRRPLAPGW